TYFDAHGKPLFVSTQLCLAIHRSILDFGCLLFEGAHLSFSLSAVDGLGLLSTSKWQWLRLMAMSMGWVLGVGCWVLDVGCWMLDVGCWMLDVGCWMLDVGCWMLDVEPGSTLPHTLK
ncbi:MAG: hypothetical protein NT167_20935, partial [Verrucomicrobia bacterium]|nr:hypothetical protein [Verrucomicrobiota bacterium]